MIDSGAHSFQKGVHVDWESYTHEYARFIREFDRPNVVGYFEMDVDNTIGYENVLRLRETLRSESGVPEKTIPVWHKNRGIDEFKAMRREMSGHVAAITGFRNEDIRDEQHAMFLKHARSQGTRIHCLGMARTLVLEKVPFDCADASSWEHCVSFGRRLDGGRQPRPKCKEDYVDQFIDSYERHMDIQKRLYIKWRSVNTGFETVPLKNQRNEPSGFHQCQAAENQKRASGNSLRNIERKPHNGEPMHNQEHRLLRNDARAGNLDHRNRLRDFRPLRGGVRVRDVPQDEALGDDLQRLSGPPPERLRVPPA
jgi:hypothetical protein